MTVSATRYEVKMTCRETDLPYVRSWLRLHPAGFVEVYPPRQVNTVYLDTPDLACLHEHVDGAPERSKLRYRWYGADNSTVRGSLELKRRSSQVGWKETHPIPVSFDLTTIVWSEWLEQLRAHAEAGAAAWLTWRNRPTLLSRYVREYLESADRQIRLTLDHDLVAYRQLMHARPNLTFPVSAVRQIVIEVKAPPDLYRRVSNVLSSFPLRTGRNSKYVDGLLGR